MRDKSTRVLSAISFIYIRSINLPVVLYFSLHSGLRHKTEDPEPFTV